MSPLSGGYLGLLLVAHQRQGVASASMHQLNLGWTSVHQAALPLARQSLGCLVTGPAAHSAAAVAAAAHRGEGAATDAAPGPSRRGGAHRGRRLPSESLFCLLASISDRTFRRTKGRRCGRSLADTPPSWWGLLAWTAAHVALQVPGLHGSAPSLHAAQTEQQQRQRKLAADLNASHQAQHEQQAHHPGGAPGLSSGAAAAAAPSSEAARGSMGPPPPLLPSQFPEHSGHHVGVLVYFRQISLLHPRINAGSGVALQPFFVRYCAWHSWSVLQVLCMPTSSIHS